MPNFRQLRNNISADPDFQKLYKHGLVSEQGNITDLGRRVQGDMAFEGKETTKEALLAEVDAVEAAVRKATRNAIRESKGLAPESDDAEATDTES